MLRAATTRLVTQTAESAVMAELESELMSLRREPSAAVVALREAHAAPIAARTRSGGSGRGRRGGAVLHRQPVEL